MVARTCAVLACGAVAVSGCALIDTQRDRIAGLMNPTKIHTAYSEGSPPDVAQQIPVKDYYHAMSWAKSSYTTSSNNVSVAATGGEKPGRDGRQSLDDVVVNGDLVKVTGVAHADAGAVDNYVMEGIGLVDAYCLRWFQQLDDLSRLMEYQSKNVNIISQLGTTLMGIAEVAPATVSAYGALNTAYAGGVENFNSSFLVAPSSALVKDHIMAVMKEKAKEFSDPATGLKGKMTFKEAYLWLERYADLCTYPRAKAIVDGALSFTKTELQADGRVMTVKRQ